MNFLSFSFSYKFKFLPATARTSSYTYNGTVLSSTYYGPTILILHIHWVHIYIEDYGYTSCYGDLDYYNGRYCVTPEYPSGIYLWCTNNKSNSYYFVSICIIF
jgi:hypothetical protein